MLHNVPVYHDENDIYIHHIVMMVAVLAVAVVVVQKSLLIVEAHLF